MTSIKQVLINVLKESHDPITRQNINRLMWASARRFGFDRPLQKMGHITISSYITKMVNSGELIKVDRVGPRGGAGFRFSALARVKYR